MFLASAQRLSIRNHAHNTPRVLAIEIRGQCGTRREKSAGSSRCGMACGDDLGMRARTEDNCWNGRTCFQVDQRSPSEACDRSRGLSEGHPALDIRRAAGCKVATGSAAEDVDHLRHRSMTCMASVTAQISAPARPIALSLRLSAAAFAGGARTARSCARSIASNSACFKRSVERSADC